jgi:hypothetical protein
MNPETVQGSTGHKPFAPFLLSFQSFFFNEHKDSQMSGAELFRSFHDRYRFFCVGYIFHGDIPLARQGKEISFPGRGIVKLAFTEEYHFTCQLRQLRKRICDLVKTGEISRPDPDGKPSGSALPAENQCRLLMYRASRMPERFSLVPVEIDVIVTLVRSYFAHHGGYRE